MGGFSDDATSVGQLIAAVEDALDKNDNLEIGSVGRAEIRAAIEAARGMPTILSAAICTSDGLIYSMPRPKRHHHVVQTAKQNGLIQHGDAIQGFLTSTGGFVDRYEGMKIAKDSGAFLGKNTPDREDLFSEDLW